MEMSNITYLERLENARKRRGNPKTFHDSATATLLDYVPKEAEI